MTDRAPVATADSPAPPATATGSRSILLISSTLGRGGAERILTLLAREWVERGHRVAVATFAGPDDHPAWPLDPRVTEHRLRLMRDRRGVVDALRMTLRRIRVLRRTVRSIRPDVIVSFIDRTNVLVLAATIGQRVPVIVTEHNDPRMERISPVWAVARALLYRRAARVVVLTDGIRDHVRRRLRLRSDVIANPVVQPSDGSGGRHASDLLGAAALDPASTIVAVGRLVHQKGFDLLLDAFAPIAADHPGVRLVIWGEGPDRPALEARREALGLTGRVHLPGATDDPAGAFRTGEVFVLSSRWEGFPTVLGEAMAAGRAVVAFDCPSGPSTIVRPDLDGLLIPPGDVRALSAGLRRVLDDPALRRQLAARAPEVLDRFGMAAILARWDGLFAEVARPGGSGVAAGVATRSTTADR